METAAAKVYALLVGIDRYRAPVRPLNGCKKDVENMRAFLQGQVPDERSLSVKTLLDGQATVPAIARHFREHLGQAGPGDVALFYFSGHGARETADPAIWTNEPDGLLEGLVGANEEGRMPTLLADKELRWLIHAIADRNAGNAPHVLIITDCCHSGDSVRALVLDEAHPLFSRQHETILPQRTWDAFLFHQDLPAAAFQQAASVAELLPEGRHLHLAACQDRQRAKEAHFPDLNGYAGVFTTTMIDELEGAGGALSYYELYRRLKLRLRYRYDQIVQLYVPGEQFDLPFRGFLNREAAAPEPMKGTVRHHETQGWYVDRGSLHGLSHRQKTLAVEPGGDGEPLSAKIESIAPDQTFISFSPQQEERLNTGQTYSCRLDAFPSAPLALYLRDDEGMDPEEREALEKRLAEGVLNLNVLSAANGAEEHGADYTLHIIRGEFRLTRKNDPFRPVVEPIAMANDGAVDRLLFYLNQMAQWTYLRDLESPQADQEVFAGKYPARLVLEEEIPGEGWREVDPKGQDLIVPFRSKKYIQRLGREEWSGRVRLSVRNDFSRRLYVSLLFLGLDFSTFGKWREQRLLFEVEPGDTLTLREVNLLYEPQIRDYNWKESPTHFTLIASTREDIDLGDLLLEQGLPAPITLEGERSLDTRGIVTDQEEDMPARDGWITRLYTLRMPNPEYNRISRARLRAMLDHPQMREYAIGLYLDQEPRSEAIELAEGIEWIGEEDAEKGLVWDALLKVANTVAKEIREAEFRRRMKRYPQRVLMVSEGDSWFQHPTVRETIDHLMSFFNIYSVGLAGAEMRDNFSSGKFVDALDDVEREYRRPARVLLLSGGGNDILGEQFQEFIQPRLEPGADPSAYLNQRFTDELEAIMALYERVFERMANDRPGVDIFTHGYDYVPAKEQKKGWINIHLQNRGLTEEADRRRLIAYLIDRFNERLAQTGAPFDRVHHVDVRRAVKPYQWHDEIHPDREGFQQVAVRFMEEIERVVRP